MSRREFVSRFYRSEDDYTKQIEHSLKSGDSYLNLPDEINFETKSSSLTPNDHYKHLESSTPNDHYKHLESSTPNDHYKAIESKPPVDIVSPGYTQTSFKDQTPKNTGCGFLYTLRRFKNKVICKSKPALEETFAYDPYKSITSNPSRHN